jgi:hypothetical protein
VKEVNAPELEFLAPPEKEKAMAKRGKVLRDPLMGPGLLMVEGKQYPFLMEGVWRSDIPAKPGLPVHVDFDPDGNLHTITPVSQSELDQEQAERGRSARSGVFDSWTTSSGILLRAAAAAGLLACWFFLTAISIHLPFFGNLDLTFWQVLGYLNTGYSLPLLEVQGNPDPGIFGFLAVLVLMGPFLPFFWRDRRSLVGGILPLGFMLLVAYRVEASIESIVAAHVTVPLQPNVHSIFSTFSVGLGAYLSASLAVCFAVLSAKKFMKSPQPREKPLCCSQAA